MLFKIVKRSEISKEKSICIRILAVFLALITSEFLFFCLI